MDKAYRVLLADNEDLFRERIAESLRKMGYECDCASNAGETTLMIGANHYDALILDVGMPGNTGLQLVRHVKEVREVLPIILVTDQPTIETAVAAVHLPVVAYLIKPVDLDTLHPHIQRSVARSRMYRAVTDVRSRFLLWDDAAGKLQQLLQDPINGNMASLTGPLLTTTFEGIVKSVIDLRRLIDLMAPTDNSAQRKELSGLLNKMELTRVALRETILILEESKHAFKSKRLGELRRQLQGLLGVLEQG